MFGKKSGKILWKQPHKERYQEKPILDLAKGPLFMQSHFPVPFLTQKVPSILHQSA